MSTYTETFTVRFLDGPCINQSRTIYEAAKVGLVITVRETGKTRAHDYEVTSVLRSGMWLVPAATAKYRRLSNKATTQPRSPNEDLAARIVAMSSRLKAAS